jgi:uncharacterized protein YlbG (UPF0298 family)
VRRESFVVYRYTGEKTEEKLSAMGFVLFNNQPGKFVENYCKRVPLVRMIFGYNRE